MNSNDGIEDEFNSAVEFIASATNQSTSQTKLKVIFVYFFFSTQN